MFWTELCFILVALMIGAGSAAYFRDGRRVRRRRDGFYFWPDAFYATD